MNAPQRTDVEDTLGACAALAREADDALAVALAGVALDEALELAERVEHLARIVYRLQVRVAGSVEAESPAAHGTRPTPSAPYRRGCDLLRTRLRITGRDARRRITAAGHLLPRLTLTGEQLPPAVENLSSVFTGNSLPEPPAGANPLDEHPAPDQYDIGADAIDAILHTVHLARQIADPDEVAEADRLLTGFAATFDPEALRKLGRVVLAHLDQDGQEPDEAAQRSRQGVRIGATWKGLTHLDIWADPIQTEVLLSVFDAGTNPRSANTSPTTDEDPERYRRDVILSERPTLDGRTRAQQMLDILITACQAALRTATLPTVAGLPPQVMVTMNLADLTASLRPSLRSDSLGLTPDPPDPPDLPPTGLGRTAHQSPVPVSLLRRLACDADLIPIVLGTEGDVLDLGRTRRLVSASMRRALIARDGGCIFPGCTIPATWTEAHHVIPWSAGGATSIENMVLLCSHHHHAIHTGHWRITPTTGEPARAAAALPGPPTPYRITTPWNPLPELTWNPHHQYA